jgi:hypothetical protein
MVVAHRYHYPDRPADVPVPVHRVAGRPLTVTHEGEELSVEEFVVKLLKRYTEELITR